MKFICCRCEQQHNYIAGHFEEKMCNNCINYIKEKHSGKS